MNKKIFLSAVLLFLSVCIEASIIKIGASLPDLGSIASSIGGDKVSVFAIAKNNSNPHFVEVLPSYMIKISKCDIFLKAGLSLDQWADQLIEGSRNGSLLTVDCSNGITVLDKPQGKVDHSMGDVHPDGNPHYWLDPSNGIIIASTVLEALKKADPQNSIYYEKNYEKFKSEAETRIENWKKEMMHISGEKIISYHSSWAYFASAFNLSVVASVEPFPGIPPTAKHLDGLVKEINAKNIKILLQEKYFPDNAPAFLASKTKIKVFKVSPSCDNTEAGSYLKHFDEIVGMLK
ncbi:MAG: metal ABC transporter substrate-binding protein [Endomicrobiaceae bacterium]|nr:metal ABC transporter substrate-binding protein [Endomicrobiaceae bacterium]